MYNSVQKLEDKVRGKIRGKGNIPDKRKQCVREIMNDKEGENKIVTSLLPFQLVICLRGGDELFLKHCMSALYIDVLILV